MTRLVLVALWMSFLAACGTAADHPADDAEARTPESTEEAGATGAGTAADLPPDDSVIAVEGFESGETDLLEPRSEDDDREGDPEGTSEGEEDHPDREGSG